LGGVSLRPGTVAHINIRSTHTQGRMRVTAFSRRKFRGNFRSHPEPRSGAPLTSKSRSATEAGRHHQSRTGEGPGTAVSVGKRDARRVAAFEAGHGIRKDCGRRARTGGTIAHQSCMARQLYQTPSTPWLTISSTGAMSGTPTATTATTGICTSGRFAVMGRHCLVKAGRAFAFSGS
jgi:hypothetical protein